MDAYAVIETGGKQYMVHENDVVSVERLDADVGSSVEIEPVLAVSNGVELVVGTPSIDGASITAEVMEHYRAKKVVSFKKKRRKGYSRKVGHRQEQTRLKIKTFLTEKAKADKPETETAEEDA